MPKSSLEKRLDQWITHHRLPEPVREVRVGAMLVEPDKSKVAAHLKGEDVKWTAGLRKRLDEVSRPPGFPVKDWRSDFVWPNYRLVVEVEGLGGGHQNITGFLRDIVKYDLWMTHFGYTVYRLGTKQLRPEHEAAVIYRLKVLLARGGWNGDRDLPAVDTKGVEQVNDVIHRIQGRVLDNR